MLDTKRELDNTDGFAVSNNFGAGGFDFDDVEGQIGIRWGAAQLFIEKIRNVWGYGEDGQIIFSRKAPSYPQLRLVVSFNDHLKFTYIQSVLFSDIVDSAQSYGNTAYYDTYRRVYRSKYMAAQLLEYSPSDKWNFSLGESIIYSDAFDPAFLIPVLFIKPLNINIGTMITRKYSAGYDIPYLRSAISIPIFLSTISIPINYSALRTTMSLPAPLVPA